MVGLKLVLNPELWHVKRMCQPLHYHASLNGDSDKLSLVRSCRSAAHCLQFYEDVVLATSECGTSKVRRDSNNNMIDDATATRSVTKMIVMLLAVMSHLYRTHHVIH